MMGGMKGYFTYDDQERQRIYCSEKRASTMTRGKRTNNSLVCSWSNEVINQVESKEEGAGR